MDALEKDRTDRSSRRINGTGAEVPGVPEDIAWRITRADSMKLYRFRGWCPSKYPRLAEKLADIVKL